MKLGFAKVDITLRREIVFSRKHWPVEEIRRRLDKCEAILQSATADEAPHPDASPEIRMNMVYAIALRRILQRALNGEPLEPPAEIHGLRLGPIVLLGSPFETFQAIRNEVRDQCKPDIALVVSFVNDSTGYAVDDTCAARGGYAADMVPLICGELPYANIHRELVQALLELNRDL